MHRRTFGFLLLGCLAVSLICVAYPVYVIQPFRHQGPRELAAALVVSRFRPMATLLAAAGAVLAAAGYWRAQPSRWRRVLPSLGAALALLLAVLGRINIYELMFRPIPRATFTAVRDVKLNGAERLIAVKIGESARAYPIRGISYHHVVNDEVGGIALVATY